MQLFEKVPSEPKSKRKMWTIVKSRRFIPRGVHKDNNLKDNNLKDTNLRNTNLKDANLKDENLKNKNFEVSFQKDECYEINRNFSIITDTVMDDYDKYLKKFSEVKTLERSTPDNPRIMTSVPVVMSDVTDSVNPVDPGSVKVEEIAKKCRANIGCGLWLKLKSLKNRNHPDSR